MEIKKPPPYGEGFANRVLIYRVSAKQLSTVQVCRDDDDGARDRQNS